MELSVGELAQVLGQSQPRVSRHLKILADGKLHQSQEHDDPQPSRIGERLESVGERKCCGHELRI
jgi:ArsR family transcriptional regulator